MRQRDRSRSRDRRRARGRRRSSSPARPKLVDTKPASHTREVAAKKERKKEKKDKACLSRSRSRGVQGKPVCHSIDIQPQKAEVAKRPPDTVEMKATVESWGKQGEVVEKPQEPVEKEQPNFETSGLLALEDNARNGVPLRYVEPPESRKSSIRWRLYLFKPGEEKETAIIKIHKGSRYLFGKDRRVVDIPTDHPTCSKQHAVLQYRLVKGHIKPYLIDLESTNGTILNGANIETARFHELREGDVIKFGKSTREFVLLHDGSANHLELPAVEVE